MNEKGTIYDMLIKDILLENKNSDRTIVIYKGIEYCYKDIYWQACNIKKQIEYKIYERKRNIGIFIPNSIEYILGFFAVLLSDNIVVPIDVSCSEYEMISTLRYCEIDMILTISNMENRLSAALSKYEHKVSVYYVDKETIKIINENMKTILKSIENVEDVAIMLHTSGTTSNPKRVMLTNKGVIKNIISNIQALSLKRSEKSLIILPMYFSYCNTAQFLSYFYVKGTLVIYDKPIFTIQNMNFFIDKYEINTIFATPTIINLMDKYKRKCVSAYKSLNKITIGGAKMNTVVLLNIMEKYKNIDFYITYGQTECSPRISTLLVNAHMDKITSVGKALQDIYIHILDEKMSELSHNQIGTIFVETDCKMKGYFKNSMASRKVFYNGWINTGDVGYVDEENYLYLVGRQKNIIISHGINVYPEEIEELIKQYEGIEECMVYGKEHEISGEEICLKYVKNNEFKLNEFNKFCHDKLALNKIPTYFECVESIEKTFNGKIRRGTL